MASDYAPRMSAQDYDRCLDQAAAAARAADVERLRMDVMVRWRGDPRADDLVETLYLHQEGLAAREAVRPPEASRITSRVATRVGQRTR